MDLAVGRFLWFFMGKNLQKLNWHGTDEIIDFDAAIQVQDENTEIEGYWGTEDWTAPEIGKEDDSPTPVYSPIRADQWSCGHYILHHIMVGMTMNADRCLLTFANRLITKDPQQQPLLLESHVASVLVFQPQQRLVDVDGERMELQAQA